MKFKISKVELIIFIVVFIISLLFLGFPSLLIVGSFPIIEIIFRCSGEDCWIYGIIIGSIINAIIVVWLFRIIKRKRK